MSGLHYLPSILIRAMFMTVATLPMPDANGRSAVSSDATIEARAQPPVLVSRDGAFRTPDGVLAEPQRTATWGRSGHLILTGGSHTSLTAAISGGRR